MNTLSWDIKPTVPDPTMKYIGKGTTAKDVYYDGEESFTVPAGTQFFVVKKHNDNLFLVDFLGDYPLWRGEGWLGRNYGYDLWLEDIEDMTFFKNASMEKQAGDVQFRNTGQNDGLYTRDIYYDGQKIGIMSYVEDASLMQFQGIEIGAQYRGQGIGKEIYRALIEEAHTRGKELQSDAITSGPARYVWESLVATGEAEKVGENMYRSKSASLQSLGWDLTVNRRGPDPEAHYIGVGVASRDIRWTLGEQPLPLIRRGTKMWIRKVRTLGYQVDVEGLPLNKFYNSGDTGYIAVSSEITNIKMFPEASLKLSWDVEQYKPKNPGWEYWEAIKEGSEITDHTGFHYFVLEKTDAGIKVKVLDGIPIVFFVPKDIVFLAGSLGAEVIR